MYVVLEPPVPSPRLGCWARPLGRYSEVLGYSHLGSFFLRDPAVREYLVLHPLMSGSNAKAYGFFESVSEFESTVLKHAEFVQRFLRPADLAVLEGRLGSLGVDEVYFPVPYPCVGGSGALSTYDKGDVWVFAHILGQSLGVG